MERRKVERYVVPEIYRKYVTFIVREVSGDFVDAELFNLSPTARVRADDQWLGMTPQL